MTGERRARFVVLSDLEVWGPRWTGKSSWPDRSTSEDWETMMVRATPRERQLFGFPAPDDDYWDEQTVRDVGMRYPGMDMTPYGGGSMHG